jgi:adenosylhomocysteine nucleosidase
MTRVAIIAAMAGELKPLVKGWQHERRNSVDLWTWRFDEGEWVAACAGAGQQAATRAFGEVEKDGPIDRVVSVGWAGALSERLVRGRAYNVAGVIDMRTGERFEAEDLALRERESGTQTHPSDKNKDVARVGHPADCSPRSQRRDLGHPDLFQVGRSGLWLVTSPRVANAAEKQRLAGVYHAGLVDMEAAAVARLAAMRGISFSCIKGVSDGLTDNLPDFNRFITPQGQFQMARFILFVILGPWFWLELIHMGQNSRKASQAIRESLFENLDRPGAVGNQNGDSSLKP